MMNPRERFLAVYDEDARNKLDRVPTFVQGVKGGFVEKYEEELFESYEGELTYNANFDAAMILGFDAVFAGIPSSIQCTGAVLKDEKGEEHKVNSSGQINTTKSTFYHKGLLYTQENLDELWSTVKRIDSSASLETTIKQYEQVSDKIFPVVMIGGIFDRMWMGMQMKYFARHYRKKTKLYRDIIKYFAEIMKHNVEGLIEATGGRAGIVNILDDVAFKGRPMLSPQRFDEDLGPYYQEITKMVSDAGMVPQIHTDGDVTELIPSFQKAGFRGLQGWEGGVDPYHITKEFPDFVCVGFGDVSHVIPHGSIEEIEAHVKELMDALKENRHFIFGPSTVVQKDDPMENVKHFMECGRKFGKY